MIAIRRLKTARGRGALEAFISWKGGRAAGHRWPRTWERRESMSGALWQDAKRMEREVRGGGAARAIPVRAASARGSERLAEQERRKRRDSEAAARRATGYDSGDEDMTRT